MAHLDLMIVILGLIIGGLMVCLGGYIISFYRPKRVLVGWFIGVIGAFVMIIPLWTFGPKAVILLALALIAAVVRLNWPEKASQ